MKGVILPKLDGEPDVGASLKIIGIVPFCHMNIEIGVFHPENIGALGFEGGAGGVVGAGASHTFPRSKQVFGSEIPRLIVFPGGQV